MRLMGFGAAALLSGCGFSTDEPKPKAEAKSGAKAADASGDGRPKVYFIKEVTAAALLKAYEATGRALPGRVGVKVSFESPNGPYLSPALLRELCGKLKGTFVDCNGFTPPRHTAEGNREVARAHGFLDVAPVDILDEEGDMDLPVTGGKAIKFHRTGAYFAAYDSLLSVVRFKAHHIAIYGGTLKNLSICLASISGKANIHSAGRNLQIYDPVDDDLCLRAMADAVKAAMDAKKDRWSFINVVDAFTPDDSCADAPPQTAFGVLSSLDPVAVDQAAVDLTFGQARDQAARQRWEDTHGVRLLQYAEEIGVGRRDYELVAL